MFTLSKKSFIRGSFLQLLISFLGTPVIHAHPNSEESVPQSVTTPDLAHIILNSPRYRAYLPTSTVIDKNELRELHVYELLKFDCSVTKMGSFGLRKQLMPKNDTLALRKHQRCLRSLINDVAAMQQLQDNLTSIAQLEDNVLAYWDVGDGNNDKGDPLNANSLELFFNSNLLPKNWRKNLNSSVFALEASTTYSMLSKAKSVADVFLWQAFQEQMILSINEGKSFYNLDYLAVFKRGFGSVISNFLPWKTVLSPDQKKIGFAATGFDTANNDYNCFKGELEKWQADQNLRISPPLKTHLAAWLDPSSTLGDRVFIGAAGTMLTLHSLYSIYHRALYGTWIGLSPDAILHPKGITGTTAYTMAAIFPLLYASSRLWLLYVSGKDTLVGMQSLLSKLELLRQRIRNVGLLLKRGKALYEWASIHPEFKDLEATKIMAAMYNKDTASPALRKIYATVSSPTIMVDSKVLYSRGKLLIAQRTLLENKDALLPFLVAIAEFDAYYSLATLYKKYEHTDMPFSLPTFSEVPRTQLVITAGWYPLIPSDNQIVSNSFVGGDNGQRAFILTGPNACGKSLFVKMVGLTVLLAQSWGLVPAQSLTLAPFDTIKTCFISEEDANKGLSTFAAETVRMNRLQSVAQKSEVKSLLLIDEPYRGTVQEITASCIAKFMNEAILPSEKCMMFLATHVQKPTDFAEQYPDIVRNHHMKIIFNNDQVNRTFTITDGPALWWFTDALKRDAFINWFQNTFKDK